MKYIKTFEGRDMRQYYLNFNSNSNIEYIYYILQKLKNDNIKYSIFSINNHFNIYFKSNSSYIYNKYCRTFDYTVSDNYDLTDCIPIKEEDIPLLINSKKFNI